MTMKLEMARKMKMAKLAAIFWVIVVFGSLPAQADPIIDGYFDPDEGYTYTTSYWIDFMVEGGKDQEPIPVPERGELWTYQDSSGNRCFAFIQPKSLVDNSYGNTAVGWGSYAPSGKNHKFQDLIGSDDARFVFTDGLGNTVLDFTMDYIHGYGTKKEHPPYASGGVVDGEGDIHVGNVTDVLDWATSLEYNWVNFGSSHPGNFGKDSYSPATDPVTSYNVGSAGPLRLGLRRNLRVPN